MTLGRMETKARWVKNYLIQVDNRNGFVCGCDFQKTGDKITMGEKFLIPNTMLIIVLTNCMTLRRMGTRAGWVKIFLIPNTT